MNLTNPNKPPIITTALGPFPAKMTLMIQKKMKMQTNPFITSPGVSNV